MINPDDVTIMVDKSNFDNKQYKADLQCAYDCGYVKGQFDILKKMKEEIEELKSDSDYYEWYGIKRTVNLIDKHIKELKGDNE